MIFCTVYRASDELAELGLLIKATATKQTSPSKGKQKTRIQLFLAWEIVICVRSLN